jgi:hypothetical protein
VNLQTSRSCNLYFFSFTGLGKYPEFLTSCVVNRHVILLIWSTMRCCLIESSERIQLCWTPVSTIFLVYPACKALVSNKIFCFVPLIRAVLMTLKQPRVSFEVYEHIVYWEVELFPLFQDNLQRIHLVHTEAIVSRTNLFAVHLRSRIIFNQIVCSSWHLLFLAVFKSTILLMFGYLFLLPNHFNYQVANING